jgi:hypothetical protein
MNILECGGRSHRLFLPQRGARTYKGGGCGHRTPGCSLVVAQVVTATNSGVVVAHNGKIELPGRWTVDGVEHATELISSADRILGVTRTGDRDALLLEPLRLETTR